MTQRSCGICNGPLMKRERKYCATCVCGTVAGGKRHYKRGERPCRACLDATARYARRYLRLDEKPPCSECGRQIGLGMRVTCGRRKCQNQRLYSTRGYEVARRRRRLRERGAHQQPYRRDDIFERDGWRCQICGRKVRRDVSYQHPTAATVDHIVSLANGGADTPINVQTAHRSCNTSKNASGPGQLRLIA